MNEFKRWKKGLEGIQELTFEEAKKLYKDYLNEKDNSKKIQKRNTIAEGLLHYTIEIAEKRYINNSVYKLIDEADLISLSINYLIKCIQDGKLLKVDSIGDLYQNDYINFIFNSETKNHDSYEMIMTSEEFTNMFMLYVEKRNKGEVNYDEYINDLLKTKNVSSLEDFCKDSALMPGNISNAFVNFEKLYKVLENKDTNSVNITATEAKIARYALYDKMIKVSGRTERIGEDKGIDETEFKQTFSKIEGLMDERLSEKERNVLYSLYGTNGKESKTTDEIAQELGISREKVSTLEWKAIRKLKDNEELKEMCKDLNKPSIAIPEETNKEI